MNQKIAAQLDTQHFKCYDLAEVLEQEIGAYQSLVHRMLLKNPHDELTNDTLSKLKQVSLKLEEVMGLLEPEVIDLYDDSVVYL